MTRGLWAHFSFALLVAACPRGDENRPPDATKTAAATAAPPLEPTAQRPKLPGDPTHGWALFKEHCTACHGASRRGTGPYRSHLPTPPADLRDPMLLGARTNDELTRSILYGVSRKNGEKVPSQPGSKKDMPAFAKELGEQDVLDLVAFLRGDSIYIEECAPPGAYFLELEAQTEGPKILGIHRSATVPKGGVVTAKSQLPPDATLYGYVTFAQLELPGAGATPIAFIADLSGEIRSVRVALPDPDHERARKDIELALKGGAEAAPKLRPLIDDLRAMQTLMKNGIKRP